MRVHVHSEMIRNYYGVENLLLSLNDWIYFKMCSAVSFQNNSCSQKKSKFISDIHILFLK